MKKRPGNPGGGVPRQDLRIKNPKAIAAKTKLGEFLDVFRSRFNPSDLSAFPSLLSLPTLPSPDQWDILNREISSVLSALGIEENSESRWSDINEINDRYRSLKLPEFFYEILVVLESTPDPMTTVRKKLCALPVESVSEPLRRVLIEAKDREIGYDELSVHEWGLISNFIESVSTDKALNEVKNRYSLSELSYKVTSALVGWMALRHLQSESLRWRAHKWDFMLAAMSLNRLSNKDINARVSPWIGQNLTDDKDYADPLERYQAIDLDSVEAKEKRAKALNRYRQLRYRKWSEIRRRGGGAFGMDLPDDFFKWEVVDKWVNAESQADLDSDT